MTKEELQKSLDNINSVITKCRITNNGQPLTGLEFNQLFIDLKNLASCIEELSNYQLQQSKSDVG